MLAKMALRFRLFCGAPGRRERILLPIRCGHFHRHFRPVQPVLQSPVRVFCRIFDQIRLAVETGSGSARGRLSCVGSSGVEGCVRCRKGFRNRSSSPLIFSIQGETYLSALLSRVQRLPVQCELRLAQAPGSGPVLWKGWLVQVHRQPGAGGRSYRPGKAPGTRHTTAGRPSLHRRRQLFEIIGLHRLQQARLDVRNLGDFAKVRLRASRAALSC